MRAELQVDGGFAYLPALNRPIIVESTDLSPQEARELEHMVSAANFFALPETVNVPPGGAADIQQYTITVEDGEQRHTVQVSDPITDQGLHQLIRYLQRRRSLR